MTINRRTLLSSSLALALSGCSNPFKERITTQAETQLTELELRSGGRLGAYILDTGSGQMIGHRMDERFAMCSTFKLSLAAAVMQLAEQGKLDLDRVLPYSESDLFQYAPVTRNNLADGGMSNLELAKAAVITSDNTAANLLLRHIGGPAALTNFWRSLGDEVSRLDRYELELNYVRSGEVQDTSSPKAMGQSMAIFLTTDALSLQLRESLASWMIETSTGMKRIRAGLPESWLHGDKTGTFYAESYANKYNDLAIFWPPERPPVIVVGFYEADGYYPNIRDQDQAVLAELGRIAAAMAIG